MTEPVPPKYQLNQQEYIALSYLLSLQGASQLTGLSISTFGTQKVTDVLMSMTPEQRKDLAIIALDDINNLFNIYKKVIDQ